MNRHNHTMPCGWIRRAAPIAWPPRSPDLTPFDFFLWVMQRPSTVRSKMIFNSWRKKDLVAAGTHNMLQNTWTEVKYHDICRTTRGVHSQIYYDKIVVERTSWVFFFVLVQISHLNNEQISGHTFLLQYLSSTHTHYLYLLFHKLHTIMFVSQDSKQEHTCNLINLASFLLKTKAFCHINQYFMQQTE